MGLHYDLDIFKTASDLLDQTTELRPHHTPDGKRQQDCDPTARLVALAARRPAARLCEWLGSSDDPAETMVFGAVIGIAKLADCLRIEDIQAGAYDAKYPWLKTHRHASGPYCWVLADVCQIAPPQPWKGKQGLFNIPDGEFRIWSTEWT